MARIDVYATPSRIYRYRHVSNNRLARELDAIKNCYIHCSTADTMNDPMEGSHRASTMFRNSKRYPTRMAEIAWLRSVIGLGSLSEVYDHEPMWGHYADEFGGICVAYHFGRLLKELGDEQSLVRVNYSEIAPKLLLGRKTPEEMFRLTLSTKTLRWSSEREWRLISPFTGKIPYSSIDCVTRVYLGSRISAADQHTVQQALEPLGIRIWKMTIDQYDIKFEEVSPLSSKPRRRVARKAKP